MKTYNAVQTLVLGIVMSCLLPAVYAADSFWNTTSDNFTNPASWTAGVPGDGTNANFTVNNNYTVTWTSDATDSNAFFNAPGNTVTLNISNSTWTTLNNFILGQNGGTVGNATLKSGTLAVTNASGTANFIISLAGTGYFKETGGTAIVDQLTATNAGVSINGLLDLQGGTFTILNGSTINSISVEGDFGPAVLNMLGGTNLFLSAGAPRSYIYGLSASMNVGGVGTVFINTNKSGGYMGGLSVGAAGDPNAQFTVSNNATVYSSFFLGNASGSTNNSLIIASGGNVTIDNSSYGFYLGNNTGSGHNTMLVTDPGTTVTNALDIFLGDSTGGSGANLMVVSNQATVVTGTLGMGTHAGAGTNTVIVTGPNSVLNETATSPTYQLAVGETDGDGNDLFVITNGGTVHAAGNVAVGAAGSSNDALIVTDNSSLLTAGKGINVGTDSSGNRLIITNGGRVFSGLAGGDNIGKTVHGSANGNSVVVDGSGSVWTNNGLYVGAGASTNSQMTISGGGMVSSVFGDVGGTSSSNTVVIVTGAGSVWTNTSILELGAYAGSDLGNTLAISNGGTVVVRSHAYIAEGSGSSASVLVDGSGSLLQVGGILGVGSNTVLSGVNGAGQVLISNGGTVEANQIGTGVNGAGSVSNIGGVYQFTTSTPTISTGNSVSVVLQNGTMSFRGVANANVYADVAGSGNQLANIAYAGNNTFRLDNSTNATGVNAYTFTTGNGATNYAAIELINGNTRWQSANLNIDGTASMLVSNTTAAIHGVVTNAGAIKVVGSTATFENSVFNGVTVKGIESDDSQVTIQGDLGNEGNLTLNNSATTVQGNLDNENSVAVSGGSLTVQGALTNGANMTVTGGSWTNQGAVNNQGVITVVGNAVIQGSVTNATGASVSVTGGSLKVQGNDVNSQGSIQVNNSAALFLSPVTIAGSYISDPSTNTFGSNVTVTASGSMAGGPGDVFNFQQSLFIHSTNNTAFDLSTSTVEFSGGGVHTNAITGLDNGNNSFGQNFEYGRLMLASTNDLLQFTQGGTSVSNALYVQTLDLSGFVSDYTSVSNMVASLLYAPSSINVYYIAPINGYLNSLRYPLESFPGGGPGGFLIPAIPEPSTMLLWVMGAGCIAWLRRRRA